MAQINAESLFKSFKKLPAQERARFFFFWPSRVLMQIAIRTSRFLATWQMRALLRPSRLSTWKCRCPPFAVMLASRVFKPWARLGAASCSLQKN